LESGWNWGLLYDTLNDCDLEVKVAPPLKVKAIPEAKIKTYKISADILAHFLRADLIPKQVLRQRMFVVRLLTMVKNKIHNLIDRQEEAREQISNFMMCAINLSS